MKKAKMLISTILTAVIILTVAACSRSGTASQGSADRSSAGQPDVELTVASAAASTNAGYQFMLDAADTATNKSGGKLKFRVVWDATLGNDGELIESCIDGSIPVIALFSSAPLLSYIPEIAIFDMPAVYESKEQAYSGISQFKNFFNDIFQKKNLKIVGMGFNGFRGLTTNQNLQTPADFRGMKIRTMENRYHMAFWTNMGSSPTPLAFSELYLALQQGLIHAQDNPIAAVYASKFYEVQKYYMPVTVFPSVLLVIMNLDAYNALPAEYKVLVEEFSETFMRVSYEQNDQTEEDAIKAMGSAISALPYTNEIKAAMKSAAEPVWTQIAQSIGADVAEAYIKTGR